MYIILWDFCVRKYVFPSHQNPAEIVTLITSIISFDYELMIFFGLLGCSVIC